jgi:hypothetical protein
MNTTEPTDPSRFSEPSRLALYATVNDQIRYYRGHQWTFATLIAALLFGIGKLAEDHRDIAATFQHRIAITVVLAVIGISGIIHIMRLQHFVTTHKRARNLLERSFEFDDWRELRDIFRLLGSKKISWWGDKFEVALWIFTFVLFDAFSCYIVWRLKAP